MCPSWDLKSTVFEKEESENVFMCRESRRSWFCRMPWCSGTCTRLTVMFKKYFLVKCFSVACVAKFILSGIRGQMLTNHANLCPLERNSANVQSFDS